ncbi:hypothetical protein ABPG75_011663 [Micractinium tetrahymenae]
MDDMIEMACDLAGAAVPPGLQLPSKPLSGVVRHAVELAFGQRSAEGADKPARRLAGFLQRHLSPALQLGPGLRADWQAKAMASVAALNLQRSQLQVALGQHCISSGSGLPAMRQCDERVASMEQGSRAALSLFLRAAQRHESPCLPAAVLQQAAAVAHIGAEVGCAVLLLARAAGLAVPAAQLAAAAMPAPVQAGDAGPAGKHASPAAAAALLHPADEQAEQPGSAASAAPGATSSMEPRQGQQVQHAQQELEREAGTSTRLLRLLAGLPLQSAGASILAGALAQQPAKQAEQQALPAACQTAIRTCATLACSAGDLQQPAPSGSKQGTPVKGAGKEPEQKAAGGAKGGSTASLSSRWHATRTSNPTKWMLCKTCCRLFRLKPSWKKAEEAPVRMHCQCAGSAHSLL